MTISQHPEFGERWDRVSREVDLLLRDSCREDQGTIDGRFAWWNRYADVMLALSDIGELARRHMSSPGGTP